MGELYETNYGIYNHLKVSKSRPLASVAMHPGEDQVHLPRLRNNMMHYVKKGIKEIYGITFLEFMALPPYIIDEMMEFCKTEQAIKQTEIAAIEKSFGKK